MKSDEQIMNDLNNKEIFSPVMLETILGLMGLARLEERKRTREEIESKSFETRLDDDDGYVKVVNPNDIDIWKK